MADNLITGLIIFIISFLGLNIMSFVLISLTKYNKKEKNTLIVFSIGWITCFFALYGTIRLAEYKPIIKP